MGLVDETCPKESFLKSMWGLRKRVNVIVLSWIMNFVEKAFLGGIMYAYTTRVVQEDLFEKYNKVDGSRIFQLHKEIATLVLPLFLSISLG